jgi:putative cell wall-binding protein
MDMKNYSKKGLISFLFFMAAILFVLAPSFSSAAKLSSYEDKRIAGSGRYETAVEISKKGWPNGADTVILARGDLFPDALAGAPLAYKLDGPILLTSSKKLPSSTKQEIKRLKAKKVIILGGSKAILDSVKKEILDMNIKVERIAGSDRYGTSVEIAKRLGASKEKAIIATGKDFPDALAIAPYAAENQYPILLTETDKLPAGVKSFLNGYKSTIVIGGKKAIDPKVEKYLPKPERIAGNSRYQTAVQIIKNHYDTNEQLYISTGENFADALTGSVLAAKNHTAVLLVNKSTLPTDSDLIVADKQVKKLQVFGGKAAVPDQIVKDFLALLNKFQQSVGTVTVGENLKVLDSNQAETIKNAEDSAVINENGTISLTLPKAEATKYKKGDIFFIPPNEENPTGFIAQVTNVSANGEIVIRQPAIDEVFKQFNIKAEKVLTPSNLVDVELEEGVTLNAGGQQAASFSEWKSLMKKRPSFLSDDNQITFSIDKPLYEGNSAEFKVVGQVAITSAEADVDVDKNWLGLINAFEYSFKSTQDSNIKFLLELNGELAPEDQTKNFQSNWLELEGVNREGRVSLATLTYQIGTAPVYGPGNRGYIQVPIGITVFLTVNAKGEAKVEMELGFIEKSKLNVGLEWKDGDFDTKFNHDVSRYLVKFDGKGELSASLGVGLEPALNIAGILPAVIQNDLSADYNFKGNVQAEYDLKDTLFTYSGCFENNFKIGFTSELKVRLAAKIPRLDIGGSLEYNKTLYEHDFFKEEYKLCENAGKISGVVTDAVTKEKLSDVKITVYKDGEFYRSTETDANGKYEIQLSDGIYKFVFSKFLYQDEVYNNVEINENEITYSPELRLIGEAFLGEGTVSGTISNSVNAQPVENATIKIRKGMNTQEGEVVATVTTNDEGQFTLNLPAGLYTGEVSKEGFITTTFNILSIGGRTISNQNASITPILDNSEIRIVLKWGETPSDLDSHLTGPAIGEERFHVYFRDQQYYENGELMAELDVDDTTSYGPETITIKNQKDGVYRYYIHDYSNKDITGSYELSQSGAQVEVYRGNHLVKTFYVPSNQPGNVWTVFELRGNEIVPINTITDSDSYQFQSNRSTDTSFLKSLKQLKK